MLHGNAADRVYRVVSVEASGAESCESIDRSGQALGQYAEPEQSNALRVSSEPLLLPLLSC